MPSLEKKVEKLSKESELNFYFEEAMNSPHTRLEYIRKVRKTEPKTRTKIGVMLACIDPTNANKVIVGFSLCNIPLDEFDKLDCGMIPKKDFGKMLAHRRAMKYSELSNFMVYSIPLDVKSPGTVYIPQTVHESLEGFVIGTYKYYKDKEFPTWVTRAYPGWLEQIREAQNPTEAEGE